MLIEELFKGIFFTSCAGSVLAAGMALLRPVTKKYFSQAWHYYMWLAVLLLMILPVRFHMPEKMAAGTAMPVQVLPADISEAIKAPAGVGSPESAPPLADVSHQAVPQVLETRADAGGILKGIDTLRRSLTAAAKTRLYHGAVIWIFGAAFFLVGNFCSYARLLRRIRKYSEAIECHALSLFTRKRIAVRKSGIFSSPFMVGIFRPVLVLPEAALAPECIYDVLRHEMVHFRRRDIWYKWFAVLVKCIHWFNPVIYFVCRQINIECEISCDLAAVAELNPAEQAHYAGTILMLAAGARDQAVSFTTGMAGSKRVLKRRFIMMKNRKKIGRGTQVLSGILAGVVTFSAVFTSGVLADGILNGDVSEWARTDLEKAGEYGILSDNMGIADYTQDITRKQFCYLASSTLSGAGITMTAHSQMPFTDLPMDETIILSLYDMGIIEGRTETEFDPDGLITREEAASILYRMYQYAGMRGSYSGWQQYADDGSISDWAKAGVYSMQASGIMQGMEDNRFGPKAYFTVEQGAASMVRLYEYLTARQGVVTAANEVYRVTRVFFSAFAHREYETMKQLCTAACTESFFGEDYVFGMREAWLQDISVWPMEEDSDREFAAFVSVRMVPHEKSVYTPDQTHNSFYLTLVKQEDGSYLVNSFATGL